MINLMCRVKGLLRFPIYFAILCSSTLFSQKYEFSSILDIKSQRYVDHVIKSIERAMKDQSHLTSECLAIQGMSGIRGRHLLNNLCSLDGTNYLEVGVWKGSTFVAALYGNQKSVNEAIAIDNWSQFGGPQEAFHENCETYLNGINYSAISEDCFTVEKSRFLHPINIYFYDGNHSSKSQELALTYFDSILDDVFIFVVDDWSWECVREGTYAALSKLMYQIIFSFELPRLPSKKERINDWWNGMFVAVIKKG